jgi:tetratricopeptide (TPR) repeat protein
MRIKGVLSAMILSAFSFTGTAQSGFASEKDSIDFCTQNLSLFGTYVKQNDYESAWDFWIRAFAQCPGSHVSIYSVGPRIVNWKLEAETNPAEKEKLFNMLMKVYDDRITYFGNDARYDKAYILGRKAIEYMQNVDPAKDPLKEKAYEWMKEAVELKGSGNEAAVLLQYFLLSDAMYKRKGNQFKQEYINDYLKIVPLLGERINSGDSISAAIRLMANRMFYESGVTDCKSLDKYYASQLESKKQDKDFLRKVLALYRNVDCEESTVYFKAAGYMYRIEPSASSANGLGVQAYNNKDYNKAISYFEEAVGLENDRLEKSKIQMKIAAVYSQLGNYVRARSASQTALSYNPNNSAAYILIAHLYVQYATLADDDAVIQRTAYWAAVDKLEKAKAVDPSSAENVNKLINSYKLHFPPQSELFIRNITGDTYTVPGWIQEKTTVR